jgi:hypothetical protein
VVQKAQKVQFWSDLRVRDPKGMTSETAGEKLSALPKLA